MDSCSQNRTYLGEYEGLNNQTNANGSTILGSIINDASTYNFIESVAVNYYNESTVTNRHVPFFVQTNQPLNNELFNRI